MVLLFDFAMPRENICTEQELYYRAVAPLGSTVRRNGDILLLPEYSTVSFDTYFNCFAYSQYYKYTQVKTISILIKAQGLLLVRLHVLSSTNGKELLQEQKVKANTDHPVILIQPLQELPEGGILSIELTAVSGCAIFQGASYLAEINEVENPVRIATVICTYKREPFVYRNIEHVTDDLYQASNCQFRKNIDFFIVDNGQTIDKAKVENEQIRVIQNKNWGGSGGFTRGIIEACREPKKYTHALLMDDDITFETQSLVRTVSFLKVLRPEYAEYSLAAGMLDRDKPYLQYGTGGIWKGRCGQLIKSSLDLRSTASLLENEREEKADYSSWWYTCIPLTVVQDWGLPFPFFIKADDEEYGIRTGRNVLFLSGADVWHDSFDAKYNARLEYYIKRNELILNALHFPGYGMMHNLAKLFLALAKQALVYQFAGVDYLLAAYLDFLKGPDFFLHTDAEILNRSLMKIDNVKNAMPFFHMIAVFFHIAAKMVFGYKKATENYRSRLGALTSFDFWCDHLKIKPVGVQMPDETMKSGSVLLK